MESDILTGKKLNQAKNNTTDEAVEEILKNAQEQLNKDMSDTARQDRMQIEKELEARKKREQERLIKDKAKADKEKAAKEKAERDRLAKEKADKEKAEKDRRAKEKADKEKAEKDRLAKEKADKEKAEKEKAAKEREEREKARRERLAKEKAEKERQQKEKAEKEKLEKEKLEKERLQKEKDLAAQEKLQQLEKNRLVKEQEEIKKFAKEWNEQEKAEKQKKALEELEKTMPKKKTDSDMGQTTRIDIQVGNKTGSQSNMNKNGLGKNQAGNKLSGYEVAASLDMSEGPIVDYDIKPPIEKKLGLTVGDVISGVLEFIWRVFKLAVLISIVTAIVGFFLSRELLIRGRNGNLHALEDMKATSTVLTNKANQDLDVTGWLKTVKREKLTMESDDGLILVARKIVQKKDSSKWVVILHGYNGSMGDIYDIAMNYYKKGYNILMPDLRASGESEGSFIGMGWLDRLDVINWIDVILDENPSAHIAIHGVDMGADTALMLSGEPIKDNIMAIVADGAYTSAWDVMKKEYHVRHEEWPVFPLMNMVNPVAKVWGGYSLKEADAVTQVSKTHVPILLIQGGQDTYVTPDMADKLNESIASAHRLVTIQSGTHEDCRYADPTTYYNSVFDFVNAHVIE